LRELAIVLPMFSGCGDDGDAEHADTGSTGASGPASTSTADDGPTDPGSATDASDEAETTAGMDSSAGETSESSGVVDSSSSSDTGRPVVCRLLLVEVLYDVDDLNDGFQWVKLYNRCDEPVDLAGYGLSYAGLDYGDPNLKQLTGTIDPFDCYLVGGPNSAPLNGDPDFELSDDFAPDLDIAEFAGSAVGLFDVPAAQITTETVPSDAVIYGPNNDSALVDETGRPLAEPHVGNAPINGSIQRTSEDPTWVTAAVPTPNVCPPF
jgi:hypothetical protein